MLYCLLDSDEICFFHFFLVFLLQTHNVDKYIEKVSLRKRRTKMEEGKKWNKLHRMWFCGNICYHNIYPFLITHIHSKIRILPLQFMIIPPPPLAHTHTHTCWILWHRSMLKRKTIAYMKGERAKVCLCPWYFLLVGYIEWAINNDKHTHIDTRLYTFS